MPRKIIPDYKVKQWLEAGLTHREIVAELAKENIFVTPQAISAWARRNGVQTVSRRRTGYPWKIREEHRQITGLWLAHRDAYAPSAAAGAPIAWQETFARARDRMKSACDCSATDHRPRHSPQPVDPSGLSAHIKDDQDSRQMTEISSAMGV